jgi:CheY-specific phosphatase CheX
MVATTEKNALDAKLVNTMMDATIEVFGTMTNTPTALKQVLAQPTYKPSGDISSVIGVAGENGEGTIALSFSSKLASILVSRLLGIDEGDLADEDCVDGIGEIVNMISGKAKTVLSEGATSPYKLSLPSIIKGANHEITHRPKGAPFLLLEFEAEGETFRLQMTFKHFNS